MVKTFKMWAEFGGQRKAHRKSLNFIFYKGSNHRRFMGEIGLSNEHVLKQNKTICF